MTATRKPRTIIDVEPYVRDDGMKRCKVTVEDQNGSRGIVALHDLTRPELQRAAAFIFPEQPGNIWLRFKSETIQTLIRNNDHAAAATAVAEVRSTPGDAPVVEPYAATPVLPAPETHNPADKLAEALRDVLGSAGTGSGVDMDTLRTVVSDEVRKVADEVRITRVEVILPDHTATMPELHHKDLPKLIAKVGAGVNLFIVGPAGTGKSVAAQQVAEALGRSFHALSFGPTTPTSKLFGYNDASGTFQETELYKAYKAGNSVFLGDELDNGHPGLLAEQNQFLANGHCAFACGMVARGDAFSYVATGNTYGRGGDRLFVGRNQLDAATLDRFVFHELQIDEDLEEKASMRYSTNDSASKCREWIALVRKVRAQAAASKLPLVISPRASIDGCKLVTTGVFTKAELIDDVLLKGVGEDTRKKLSV